MTLAFINVFIALFIFGIIVAFLGVIKLPLAQKLFLDDARMAWLISLNQFSNLIGLLISGYWLVSISYKLVLSFGFLIIIISLWLIATYKTAFPIALALSGLGLGGSFLNAGSNALLPVLNPNNPTAITNLAHAFFGFGALVAPIMIAYLLKIWGWQKALKGLAILIIIPALAVLSASYPISQSVSGSPSKIALLGNPIITLVLIASFCHIGIEAAFSTWLSTYLKYVGWNEIKASSLIAFFWLALMFSRLLAGGLITLNNGKLVIELLVLVLIITLIVMTTLVTPWISLLSITVLGFCCGPIFPTLVGVTFAKFDSDLSGNIYALISAAGMGGATILPYILGRLSSSLSIYYGLKFLVAPASTVLIISMFL